MHDDSVFLAVDQAYDRWSSFYDVYDNPMVFGATQVVDQLAAQTPAQVVVEFGCGTGRNLARWRDAGAHTLIGCDLSAGMLAQARARSAGFTLLQQDMAQPLPVADGSVDLALFCLTLEHMADLVTPLREARRLVRAEGRVAVIEIHPFLSHCHVSAHFRQGKDTVRMPTYTHRFCDYLRAFTQADLVVEHCQEWMPGDFPESAPQKVFKRGAQMPLIVQFTLRPRFAPGDHA